MITNKNIYISKIRKISQQFLRMSVLMEELSLSLEHRKQDNTLKEMKEYYKKMLKSKIKLLCVMLNKTEIEDILIEIKGGENKNG